VEENQFWVGLLLCYLAFIIFFPGLWLFLAGLPVFWLAQVFLFIAFGLLKDQKTKKLNGWGQAIVCVVAAAVIGSFVGSSQKPSASASTGSARQFSLPSFNPFGSLLPKENKEMHEAVVKFWQGDEGLPGDFIGQQTMIRLSDEAGYFNQFEADGKLPLRREVRGRWKVGVMGIDEKFWAEVGNDASLTKSAHHNLLVASYLYRTYGDLPWSGYLTRNSRVVIVPATGRSEKIPMGHRQLHLHPSEAMTVTNDKDKEYRVTLDARGDAFLTIAGKVTQDFPYTEWVQYAAISGKPAIVLVTPHSEMMVR
jgi:hypothetical protein